MSAERPVIYVIAYIIVHTEVGMSHISRRENLDPVSEIVRMMAVEMMQPFVLYEIPVARVDSLYRMVVDAEVVMHPGPRL